VIEFELNGKAVEVPDSGVSLLEVLRDNLRVLSPKDGCSPQGQCGCCTVWVDGKARVSCVTPAKRVDGRQVTTIEGLAEADSWADSFCRSGASQCGFCTPGIIMRLAALSAQDQVDTDAVDKALVAHLCRCTGWNSIVDACVNRAEPAASDDHRDLVAASRRAELEGGTSQVVGTQVALGRGGFADDLAPADALVAMLDRDGEWVVAETMSEARLVAGKVQGRRTTAPLTWPIDIPAGEWARTLQTTWVEPAYLEPDATWCEPGGEPVSALANGGAFGGKVESEVADVARRLADVHARAVRVVMTREDTVRFGAKRPPVAAGISADGTGIVRLASPKSAFAEGRIRSAINTVTPLLEVEFVDVPGPPVSDALRATGWAEALVLASSLDVSSDRAVAPNGAIAQATIREMDGETVVSVNVRCGEILDPVVLRSYCVGAAHIGLGWVRSEGIVVDGTGNPLDLTIRSFGILRALDTPRVEVILEPHDGPAVNGSDAVFAAVAAAAWRVSGYPARWPLGANTGP
jgi:xanthine dehydrogenase small subunit